MNYAAEVLTALVLVVVLWLVVEVIQHRRALKRIPIRIHVNGTRGKSSVTRLLAAGIRGSEMRVVAKTTGTLARVIMPNARELAVYRPMGANVREQVRVVRFAAAHKADVLVVECMALQPILQWLSEKMFVRATHGVITNARPDHLDVMGPSGNDVAKALCGMTPRGGVLLTAERERLSILEHAAKDRGTRLEAVGRDEVDALTDADMEGFGYYEHRENVALALSTCEALGIDRASALRRMKDSPPDPGALSFFSLRFFGREMVFVNGFAANDPVSSQQIWDLCLRRYPEHHKICLFNCRSDRADRSRQLGKSLADWTLPEQVVTVGTGTLFFTHAAQRAGFDVSRVLNLEGLDVWDVFERLIELCPRRTVIVGLGNIGGIGLALTRLFRNRSTVEDARPAEDSVPQGEASLPQRSGTRPALTASSTDEQPSATPKQGGNP
jgi:poly-gamma-glutamate synthase PgsB/CapB